MSMLLTPTASTQLFRSTTISSVSSPSVSPSDDIVMDFPSSPPFLPHDSPSTPTTPGGRSAFRPPNSAKRIRRITHVNTDPYPTTMHINTRRLSAIPSDNDIEHAYKHMSDFESPTAMSPVSRRKPPRSVFHDSRLQPSPQLLSPLPLGHTPVVPQRSTAADDLNETLAQAIRLLSLEKKVESYPSTDASSQYSPLASSNTSFADEQSPTVPDPEELLKEIVRNSLQSLHALRLAKAMERDIKGARRSSTDTDMEVDNSQGEASGVGSTGSAIQVVAYLDQSVNTINSARQVIEFAEETLSDTRDRVRDALMKG